MNYKLVAIACILASAIHAKNYLAPEQEQEEVETPTRPVTPQQPVPLTQAIAVQDFNASNSSLNWQGASGALNISQASRGGRRSIGRRAMALTPQREAELQAELAIARPLE